MGLTTRHHRTPSHCSITATDHHGGWDVVLDMIHISTSSNTNSRQCDTTLPITLASQLLISFYLNLSDNYFTNDRDKYISRLLKCYGVSNLTLSSVLNFYCDHINTSTSNTSLKYFVLLGSRLCHPLLPIVLLSRSLSPVISATNSHHDDEQLPVSPLSDDTMVSLPSVPIYLRTALWARPEATTICDTDTEDWDQHCHDPGCPNLSTHVPVLCIQALVRRRTSWLSAQEK